MPKRVRFQRWLLLLAACLSCCACGEAEPGGVGGESAAGEARVGTEASTATAEIVGSVRCASCHAVETAAWRGSHHDHAMETATPDTVRGAFDGQTLQNFERSWRFLREGDDFFVEVSEPGLEPLRLAVESTFGFAPLQQYLVSIGGGRIQALPVAWDTRPAEQGGQRWFHLAPEMPLPPGDPLHWKALAYSWNSQCASCHSTNLVKGYDAETDRFETRYSEIDVGCEACHGAGSVHVARMESDQSEWASAAEGGERGTGSGLSVTFDDWDPDAWKRAEGVPIAKRVKPLAHDSQIDVCAPCHSRRSPLVDAPRPGEAFLDGYRPSLLTPDLYFEDGQILEEVYVYGSFLQSKMHAAGVRCGDCHDPHSLSLRREGNALCAGCHDPGRFDSTAHHGHDPATEAGACVTCHMPDRVYMQVDARRDHSFPIPRPDRRESLGTPDACARCHPQEGAEWAAHAIDGWRDPARSRPPHWADGLLADGVLRTDPARWIEIGLDPATPPLVRSSAWARLAGESESMPPPELVRDRLSRASALERLGLIELVARMAPPLRVELLRPLLDDDRRAVRAAAAEALADVPAELWRPADRSALARGLAEYRQSQEANAERPEAQVSLAGLAIRYGDLEAARAAYLRALDRAPYFVPAYVNLADLERAVGNEEAAVLRLRQALEIVPEDARVRYALGLALHRMGRAEEALAELEEAALRAPGDPRLVLARGLSLDAAGRRGDAIVVLEEAVDRGVANGDLMHALVSLLRDEGELERARARARQWQAAAPGDVRASQVLESLGSGPR